jgi:hypothetical protein
MTETPVREPATQSEKPSVWPPYAGLDMLAVILLAALALVGLSPIFEGTDWILVAVLGGMIGLGWTLLLLGLRLGLPLVIESIGIPYLLTAGLVALRKGGWFYLPDAETLGEVLAGSGSAWKRVAETVPPVDSTGVVLLIPYLLTFFGVGIATAMALRSRRPLLPLLPLLLVLVAVQVLGLYSDQSSVLPALGFAVVSIWWLTHRGNRPDPARPGRTPAAAGFSWMQVATRGVVFAIAVAAVVPFVIDSPRDRWLLREAVTPYDSETFVTPLADFRRFRPGFSNSLAHDRLFTVEGVPQGTRVRLTVLDVYDGEQWVAAADRGPGDTFDRFLRVPRTMDLPGPGNPDTATITMARDWRFDWLPVVGRVQAFNFFEQGQRSRDRLEALRYNRSTGTALLPGGLPEGEVYGVSTVIAQPTLRPTMKPWPHRDDELWQAGEFLDPAVITWSHGTTEPMEALFQMAATLRKRGRFSDGAGGWEEQFTAGHDQQRLGEDFVFGEMQVGNHEQYAATMALLANRLGIPARVVVGTVLGNGKHVKGKDVSAWVEVRIANGTWRTLPAPAFMSRRPPEHGEQPLPDIQVPANPQLPPAAKPEETKKKPPREFEEPEEESTTEEVVTEANWSLRQLLWLLLVVPVVPPLAKAVRRRRRRRATPVSRRFVGGWDEVLDLARDLGSGVASTSRPRQALALEVPGALARTADIAAFSPESPDASAGDAYWSEVRDVRRDLARRAPRWRRILAAFNPASLLPRRR